MKRRILKILFMVCILFLLLSKVVYAKDYHSSDKYISQLSKHTIIAIWETPPSSTDSNETLLVSPMETNEDNLFNFWIGIIIFAFGAYFAKMSKDQSK